MKDSVMIFGRSIGTGPAMAIASTPGLAGATPRALWVHGVPRSLWKYKTCCEFLVLVCGKVWMLF